MFFYTVTLTKQKTNIKYKGKTILSRDNVADVICLKKNQ
jgi:hypothetical protein